MAAKKKSKSNLTDGESGGKRQYALQSPTVPDAGVSPFMAMPIPGLADSLVKVSAPEIVKWDKSEVGDIATGIIKGFGQSPLSEYRNPNAEISETEMITVDCVIPNDPEKGGYRIEEKMFPNTAVTRSALERFFEPIDGDWSEHAIGCVIVIRNQGKRTNRSTMNEAPSKQRKYYNFEVSIGVPKGNPMAKKVKNHVDVEAIYNEASTR